MNIHILDLNFDKAKEIGNKIFTNITLIQNGQNSMLENKTQYEFFNEQINVK